METVIASLISRFEKGSLSRRDLIQGLAMLTAAGGAPAAQGQSAAIKGIKIDHISIQVSDLPGSIAFYQKMFRFSVVSEDKPNEIVRLGAGKTVVSLHHKSPTGMVDHFAIGVDNFNQETMTAQLKSLGAIPENNLDAGFHIKDPQGISVQIVAA
jgi:catechol-2,3-dioxygenase